MRDKPPTPPETLAFARNIAMANGVHFAYTGNVHDRGRKLYCSHCGALLIERDWYQIGIMEPGSGWQLRAVAAPLPGLFDRKPGVWGARRLPVRMKELIASRQTMERMSLIEQADLLESLMMFRHNAPFFRRGRMWFRNLQIYL